MDQACEQPPPYDVFATLPPEIVLMILSFVGFDEERALAVCCRSMWRTIGKVTREVRLSRILKLQPMVVTLPRPLPKHVQKYADTPYSNDYCIPGPMCLTAVCYITRNGTRSKIISPSTNASIVLYNRVISMVNHPEFKDICFFTTDHHMYVWDGKYSRSKFEVCGYKPISELHVIGKAIHITATNWSRDKKFHLVF